MTLDELTDRLLNAERRITAIENGLCAPRSSAEMCDGHHIGHPCQDPDCWVLVRCREQHET